MRNLNSSSLGAAISPGMQTGTAIDAPSLLQNSLIRLSDSLERAVQIAHRQGMFVDRLRGTQPEEASDKRDVRGEPQSVVARLNDSIDTLELILGRFQQLTNEMDRLA